MTTARNAAVAEAERTRRIQGFMNGLFEGGEVAIRSILRSTPTMTERRRAVAQAMTDCVRLKPDVHTGHGNQQMSRIGG